MEILLVIAVVLVFILSLVPNILSKRLLRQLSELLLNNEFEEFYKLINTKKAKLLLPSYNKEYLLLNSYILKKDDAKVKEQYNKIFNMKLSKQQERVIYLEAFNYYYNTSDRDMIDKIHNRIQTFDEENIKKENQIIYDICVLKLSNHIEEMEEEYNKTNNKQTAMMLYLQYKNKNDTVNMEKYKNLL